MASLVAYQHFYSRLSREESPKRQSGFQTVFRSKELTPEAVRAIEDRSQYNSAPGDPVKRQFYALPSGFVCISQSVPLAELDEFGRKGRYLTHSLILRGEDFQALGAPFEVFSQFDFVTTLKNMLEQGERATGHAPALKQDIHPEWERRAAQLAQQWRSENLVKLGRLAWQAARLVETREAVFLLGNDAEQMDTLMVLFYLASPTRRAQLSFDTHALGCNWGREVVFWAQGFRSSDQPIRMPHKVDCQARTIESDFSSQDDGLFGKWMIESGLKDGFTNLPQRQLWASYLESYLRDSYSLPPMPIPDVIVERIARLDVEAVATRWVSCFPGGISRELTWSSQSPLPRMPGEYLKLLIQGVTTLEAQETLFERLLELLEPPAKNDRQILDKWIRANEHYGLIALTAFWAKDDKAWTKAIANVSFSQYDQLLTSIARWKEGPRYMFLALVSSHSKQWLTKYARLLAPEEWKRTMDVLASFDDGAVGEVSSHLYTLSPQAQEEIANWLEGYKGEAPLLRAALNVPLKTSRLKLPKLPFGKRE